MQINSATTYLFNSSQHVALGTDLGQIVILEKCALIEDTSSLADPIEIKSSHDMVSVNECGSCPQVIHEFPTPNRPIVETKPEWKTVYLPPNVYKQVAYIASNDMWYILC